MKIITKKQFRFLLTLSIIMVTASAMVGAFTDSWLLPEPLREYQKTQNAIPPSVGELVISFLGLPGLIAGFISIIGLYRFWPCARSLGVTAWIYMLVWMAFSPRPVISSALDGALSDGSILLAGVVLALIYFSPAADWFQRKA